jgi:uncharacterized membrane protein
MLHNRIGRLTGICAPTLLLASIGSAQTFQILEMPPGSPGGQAFGVSANGQFIAGFTTAPKSGVVLATIWNELGQPTTLPDYGSMNIAHAISDSGEVVAGEAEVGAVVWGGKFGGGDALLGPGAALDMTPDGQTVVGNLQFGTEGTVAFMRLSVGAVILLLPAEGDSSSSAQGITSDATLVAGSSARFEGPPPNPAFFSRACVWSGFEPTFLNPLAGSSISHANAISADGSVVVGFGAEAGEFTPTTAVRWVGGEPQALAPGEFSNALDVSADGQVVVGEAFAGAFVWDPERGRREIRQVLVAAGVDLDGIALVAARSVSADGSVIVGWGLDLKTSSEIAWRAILPTMPACAADFNNDGEPNSQDFFDFLAAFFASDTSADFNHDEQVNSQDFFDFLSAFFAGC